MAKYRLIRAAAGVVALGVAAILLGELALLLDVYRFEYEPILDLIGYIGVAWILFVNAGLVVLCWRAFLIALDELPRARITTNVFLTMWVILLLWIVQWTFMQRPLSTRV